MCILIFNSIYIYNTKFTICSLGIFYNQYQVHIQFYINSPNKINILIIKLTYHCISFIKSTNCLPNIIHLNFQILSKILLINTMDASSTSINPTILSPFHTIHFQFCISYLKIKCSNTPNC